MAKLIVQTPEGVEIRQELAGAGSRAAAAVVDGLIFLVVAVSVGLVLALVASFGGTGLEGFLLGLYLGGITLVGMAYPFLWHVLRNGQTPGKKLVGVRVTSADGSPASTVQHLLRSLILIVDVLPVPVPLGLLLAAITPRHTRLGDLAAGTLVLRVTDAEAVSEPWASERWSTLEGKHLEFDARASSTLDPRDLAFLRDVVTRRDIDAEARNALLDSVAEVYCRKLGVVRPPSLVKSAALVRELYLYAREHAPRGN
ncbi:MAG: RDD family protein [Planctomycetota bacterium]|nr:RDD family protein [Planctomycetota bacterium]